MSGAYFHTDGGAEFRGAAGVGGDLEEEFMLGRLSNPKEFRGVVIILLSKASSFMTGVRLNVNGGQTAC
jgi:NAD(P)-dependent dehydrogenase (short-subunit alcohol dehydrogenase family)